MSTVILIIRKNYKQTTPQEADTLYFRDTGKKNAYENDLGPGVCAGVEAAWVGPVRPWVHPSYRGRERKKKDRKSKQGRRGEKEGGGKKKEP